MCGFRRDVLCIDRAALSLAATAALASERPRGPITLLIGVRHWLKP